jgi:hypothetical protein
MGADTTSFYPLGFRRVLDFWVFDVRQSAGDHHLSLIAAVFAFAYLSLLDFAHAIVSLRTGVMEYWSTAKRHQTVSHYSNIPKVIEKCWTVFWQWIPI